MDLLITLLAKFGLKFKEKRKKKIFVLRDNDDGRSREEIIKLAKVRRLEAEIRNRRS